MLWDIKRVDIKILSELILGVRLRIFTSFFSLSSPCPERVLAESDNFFHFTFFHIYIYIYNLLSFIKNLLKNNWAESLIVTNLFYPKKKKKTLSVKKGNIKWWKELREGLLRMVHSTHISTNCLRARQAFPLLVTCICTNTFTCATCKMHTTWVYQVTFTFYKWKCSFFLKSMVEILSLLPRGKSGK